MKKAIFAALTSILCVLSPLTCFAGNNNYAAYRAEKDRAYKQYQQEKEDSYKRNRNKSYAERRADYEDVYNRNRRNYENIYNKYHSGSYTSSGSNNCSSCTSGDNAVTSEAFNTADTTTPADTSDGGTWIYGSWQNGNTVYSIDPSGVATIDGDTYIGTTITNGDTAVFTGLNTMTPGVTIGISSEFTRKSDNEVSVKSYRRKTDTNANILYNDTIVVNLYR